MTDIEPNEVVTAEKDDPDPIRSCEAENNNDSIKCPGCKCNCLTDSVFCELDLNWIHYKCDGLNETDIKRLHSDAGFIYKCKRCLSNENNTLCKQPVNSISKSTSGLKTLILPEAHSRALNRIEGRHNLY